MLKWRNQESVQIACMTSGKGNSNYKIGVQPGHYLYYDEKLE
jgi:hypothetical protein